MIETKFIAKTYVGTNLSNAHHVSFFERVSGRFSDYNKNHTGDNEMPKKLKDQWLAFRMAYNSEDQAYKVSTKSDYTEKIQEQDALRYDDLTALRSLVQVYLHRKSDTEKYAAAKKVFDKMETYKIQNNEGYESEGSKIKKMTDDMNVNYQLELALKAIGGWELVQDLKAHNDECRRLVNLRNEERSYASTDKLRDLRWQTELEYRDLIWLLNAFDAVNDNHPYMDLINVLNQDIEYYEKTVLARYGKKEEGADGGDETPEEQDGEVTPENTQSKE